MKSNFYQTAGLLACCLFLLISAQAAHGDSSILIPPAPKIAAKSYYLIDFDSGSILANHNSEEKLAPASLTKIMTAYVVFRELVSGNLKLDDEVTISKKAWKTPGSRMFVEVNKRVTVEKLLKGMIIQSGNDASVALAEHIAGDEETFAELMNQQAARLGMVNSHFTNSMGLPSSEHYMTAQDLALLTRVLISEFPDFYSWHAIREFTFNGIKQRNRNKLLWRDDTVDGVKTGHTEEAGYCLVASALRDDMRLISVVLGAASVSSRASANQTLLNYGFRFFETRQLYSINDTIQDLPVWKGDVDEVAVGTRRDIYVTVPRRHVKDLKETISINDKVVAPLTKGKALGMLSIQLGDKTLVKEPLITLKAVAQGGIFKQLYDEARLRFK
ncbi:MAG: D-alanyl-D-alanine carboxypeptidase family protein [Methylococcales bacterium]